MEGRASVALASERNALRHTTMRLEASSTLSSPNLASLQKTNATVPLTQQSDGPITSCSAQVLASGERQEPKTGARLTLSAIARTDSRGQSAAAPFPSLMDGVYRSKIGHQQRDAAHFSSGSEQPNPIRGSIESVNQEHQALQEPVVADTSPNVTSNTPGTGLPQTPGSSIRVVAPGQARSHAGSSTHVPRELRGNPTNASTSEAIPRPVSRSVALPDVTATIPQRHGDTHITLTMLGKRVSSTRNIDSLTTMTQLYRLAHLTLVANHRDKAMQDIIQVGLILVAIETPTENETYEEKSVRIQETYFAAVLRADHVSFDEYLASVRELQSTGAIGDLGCEALMLLDAVD